MRVCPDCGRDYRSSEGSNEGPDEAFCHADGAKLVDVASDPLIAQTVGSYKITRVLGQGGMGKVYLGIQLAIGSRVAIKVLSADCAERPDLVDRFFSEAKTVNKIRHESIVNILDLATLPDGRPFIIMEFLEGQPFSQVIRNIGALPIGTLSRVMVEILGALEAAHQKGVVHRDLKPDNIFITPQGRAKVLDFGIAKLMPDYGTQAVAAVTKTGAVLGTPSYMAPEQISGGNIDRTSDLYAAGVILFEAATGQLPFTGSTLFELMQKHVSEPPPRPTSLRPDLPLAFEHVILRALAKQQNERFQSADEMARAITQAAEALPQAAWANITAAGSLSNMLRMSSQMSAAGKDVSSHGSTTPAGPQDSWAPTAAGHTAARGTDPTAVSPPSLFNADQTPQLGAHQTPQHPSTPELHPVTSASPSHAGAAPAKGGRTMLIASLIALATVGGGTATYLMTQDGGRGTAASAAAFDAGAETSAESHDGAIELAAADPPPVQDDPPKTPTTDDPPSHRDKPTRTSAPSKPAPAPTPAPTPTKADPVESAKPVPDKKDDTGITHIGGVTFIDGAKQAESATGLKSLSFKPTFNTKAFKAEKWWRTAKKHAEKLMPDLVLTDFEVKYVMSNGLANLSYRGAEASYWFRSKSRSKRPKNIPRGVEHEIYCMVYVDVSKSKIQVYAASREKCRGSLRPPRCSLKHVMKKAREIGMPQGAAEVDLLDDGWYVQIDEWSETIPDDC